VFTFEAWRDATERLETERGPRLGLGVTEGRSDDAGGKGGEEAEARGSEEDVVVVAVRGEGREVGLDLGGRGDARDDDSEKEMERTVEEGRGVNLRRRQKRNVVSGVYPDSVGRDEVDTEVRTLQTLKRDDEKKGKAVISGGMTTTKKKHQRDRDADDVAESIMGSEVADTESRQLLPSIHPTTSFSSSTNPQNLTSSPSFNISPPLSNTNSSNTDSLQRKRYRGDNAWRVWLPDCVWRPLQVSMACCSPPATKTSLPQFLEMLLAIVGMDGDSPPASTPSGSHGSDGSHGGGGVDDDGRGSGGESRGEDSQNAGNAVQVPIVTTGDGGAANIVLLNMKLTEERDVGDEGSLVERWDQNLRDLERVIASSAGGSIRSRMILSDEGDRHGDDGDEEEGKEIEDDEVAREEGKEEEVEEEE
jgi:hypothetical protein